MVSTHRLGTIWPSLRLSIDTSAGHCLAVLTTPYRHIGWALSGRPYDPVSTHRLGTVWPSLRLHIDTSAGHCLAVLTTPYRHICWALSGRLRPLYRFQMVIWLISSNNLKYCSVIGFTGTIIFFMVVIRQIRAGNSL